MILYLTTCSDDLHKSIMQLTQSRNSLLIPLILILMILIHIIEKSLLELFSILLYSHSSIYILCMIFNLSTSSCELLSGDTHAFSQAHFRYVQDIIDHGRYDAGRRPIFVFVKNKMW